MQITRRRFLKTGVSLAAGLAAWRMGLGPLPALAPPKKGQVFLRRKIPVSGEEIPAIGLGTWQTFDYSPSSSKYAGIRDVLRLFAHSGGTLVDTATIYGRAEENIGVLSEELKVKTALFHATKVWAWAGIRSNAQINGSFERLGVKTMDLHQVHNLIDLKDQLKKLRAMKEEGRVRYVGITHWRSHAHDELIEAMKKVKPDFVQFNLNVADRNAEKRLLPLAQDMGVATLINRPFEGGDLFDRVEGKPLPPWAKDYNIHAWSQFFLKYLLSFPGVTCPIPATSNPEHLMENMQAGFGPLPDPKTRAKMAALF